MARSQKAEIASRPRCPLPSGSKADGPMGSSTIASSVNTDSQASLSRAITASLERRPASCAGCLSVMTWTISPEARPAYPMGGVRYGLGSKDSSRLVADDRGMRLLVIADVPPTLDMDMGAYVAA